MATAGKMDYQGSLEAENDAKKPRIWPVTASKKGSIMESGNQEGKDDVLLDGLLSETGRYLWVTKVSMEPVRNCLWMTLRVA